MKFIKNMKKRDSIILLAASSLVIVLAVIGLFAILSNNDNLEGVVVSIGAQEFTTQEVEMIARLYDGDPDEELLIGMHMYTEIMNMLLFQYATNLGIAPTDAETLAFIDEVRHFVPESDFVEMRITVEEYWSGIGFRLAQNMLMANNLMQYLNDNDPTTQFPFEQYQNFIALGRELMRYWMSENPVLTTEFMLDEAALVFASFENY